MARRLAAAALSAAIAAGAALGCGHEYLFEELPGCVRPYVNTAPGHYRVRKTVEDAERELVLLARDSSERFEESFVHSQRDGMLYEIGFDETNDGNGNMAVWTDKSIWDRFGRGDSLAFCHVHMASVYTPDDVRVIRAVNRSMMKSLMKNAWLKSSMAAETRGVQEAIERQAWILSSEENETSNMMVRLAIPSHRDFGMACYQMMKARGRGMGCRYMIASPFGITEIGFNEKEMPGSDLLGLFGSKLDSMYADFFTRVARYDKVGLAMDTDGCFCSMAGAGRGLFSVRFRDAGSLGLPPFIYKPGSPDRQEAGPLTQAAAQAGHVPESDQHDP